jgi:hypothetical protein
MDTSWLGAAERQRRVDQGASLTAHRFNTPFTPLRDEIASFLQFWLNSIALCEHIEQGRL